MLSGYLSLKASHYTVNDYDTGVLIEDSGALKLHKENRHTIDMVEKNLVQLEIDHLQMGVGGENSWGSQPTEEYQLKPRKYIYHFSMQLIEPLDEPRNIYKNSFKHN